MLQVQLRDEDKQLSSLISEVEAGESVTILRSGKPVAAAIFYDLQRGLNAVPYGLNDVVAAMELHRLHAFQFFDCQIVATVARVGCAILLTEDMQHGRTLDGVEILNPFKLSVKELDNLIR